MKYVEKYKGSPFFWMVFVMHFPMGETVKITESLIFTENGQLKCSLDISQLKKKQAQSPTLNQPKHWICILALFAAPKKNTVDLSNLRNQTSGISRIGSTVYINYQTTTGCRIYNKITCINMYIYP